jgi:hypothetical protein
MTTQVAIPNDNNSRLNSEDNPDDTHLMTTIPDNTKYGNWDDSLEIQRQVTTIPNVNSDENLEDIIEDITY